MFSSPIVRPASLAERADLRDIKVRVSLMWPDFRRKLLDDPQWTHIDERGIVEGRTLVVEAAGETVGFLTLTSRPDGDTEVHNIFVDPGHWGSDLPGLLIEGAVQMARDAGADHLWMVTSEAAVPFYESLAFERAGEVETDGRPQVALLRPLSDTIGNA